MLGSFFPQRCCCTLGTLDLVVTYTGCEPRKTYEGIDELGEVVSTGRRAAHQIQGIRNVHQSKCVTDFMIQNIRRVIWKYDDVAWSAGAERSGLCQGNREGESHVRQARQSGNLYDVNSIPIRKFLQKVISLSPVSIHFKPSSAV